jgi:hypothetical protein
MQLVKYKIYFAAMKSKPPPPQIFSEEKGIKFIIVEQRKREIPKHM